MSEHSNLKLEGQPTSPGLAMGKAFVYFSNVDSLSLPHSITEKQIVEELEQIENAVRKVKGDLKISACRIEAHAGAELASIFEVHDVMLEDSSLRAEIRDEIERELISAAMALTRVFDRRKDKFRTHDNQMVRERADDLEDLQSRLLRKIAGVKTTALETMPAGRVLVAHRLLPSDTVALPERAVAAIVLEFGGPGSHAAILARALGVPTVAEIPEATQTIKDHQTLIVNGNSGEIIVDPDIPTRVLFRKKINRFRLEMQEVRRLSIELPCTYKETVVAVTANVGCLEDVVAAADNGADGVGLYRMEQFYLSRNTPPSKTDLLNEFRKTFAPLQGKPITVRLLDLGADKPVEFVHFTREDDPFLGRRGVRLLLQYPDLLDTQLEALLEFTEEQDVRIMVPMVTLATDMERIRQRLWGIAERSGIRKVPLLGAMIETPAAALCIKEIIPHAEFLSIGTNDLTQYTMAAGRENPLVSEYFIQNHPAILRLLGLILEDSGDMPVSICGELAAQADIIPTLLKIGVRSFSVAPPFVPRVKEAIRQAGKAPDHSQGAS
ncbi:MAG TPA: phosphoenolpyruvate--protein phosphotransferase [Chthoniobacterales bacterium]